MERPYSSRTRLWRKDERGTASVTVLLLFCVFSGLGLAMLHASGLHLKINAFRKFSMILDYASENGLKRGLQDLAARLGAEALPPAVAAESVERLRDDPAGGFALLLEEGLGPVFPRVLDESCAGLRWESRAACAFERLADKGGHFLITGSLLIESSGGSSRLGRTKRSALEGSIGFLAGRLPLPALPFFIKKDMTEAQKEAFLADEGVRFVPKPGEFLKPGLSAAADGVLTDDMGAAVAKALNIGVFRPGDLTPARLREALGLEPSTEPVPDGVYLVRNDLGLGGVFVQGGLDEMVLAVSGQAQVIAFRASGAEWLLEFSPSESRTVFRTPEGSLAFDLVPLPIVIVNGSVASLGGGWVDGAGRVEMLDDPDRASVLTGVGLTIVAADKVTISSHLILQGVRWQDGVPYAKDSRADLVICSTGRDAASGEAREGGVAVAAGAPDGLKLQASITAASGGFSIEGPGKEVELLGALHASGYEGNGSTLAVVRDERVAAGVFPEHAPLTAEPRLALVSIKVLAWQEY